MTSLPFSPSAEYHIPGYPKVLAVCPYCRGAHRDAAPERPEGMTVSEHPGLWRRIATRVLARSERETPSEPPIV